MLESTTALVEDGSYVLTLDWDIEPGLNYGLRCTSEDPQALEGGHVVDPNHLYEVETFDHHQQHGWPELDYYYFCKWWLSPNPSSVCLIELVSR